MTLQSYLRHRKRYEVAASIALILLIGVVLATSKIIENVRDGAPSCWPGAFATEFTATFSILLLMPPLAWFLQTLQLNWSNARLRILWHIPAFLCFSLAHIALFVLLRKVLWRSVGASYEFGPVFLGLLYEMRKGLLVYVFLVVLMLGYQFILTRLQGEAGFIDSDSEDTPAWTSQFLVKMLNRQFLVKADAIEWVQSASNYVILHTDNRSYPMRQTMSGLAGQLDPATFLRVHRTAIVNINTVVALQEGPEAQLELRNGDRVPVSKPYLPALRAALAH
ncbi:hypothetical protein PHACT_08975 [Pseudohongiella acticola]|jgi:LytTr DNA-binding domain-containing protein|uniref:HTH LytTR-type domain-containing protein n=1 Tax=Pseudohongiella acticola TaxID=1524254 RepID=A0A1E8CLA4_9GAMM|nr:LytTR family DNA-binding domain-containing protein [Pseudohongiella acticola]OFE13251.1 hypothetical protein PHACT_08975 [Pseudohongiella acticola]